MVNKLNVLIYGIYPDIHTDAVAWALREKGVNVDVWNQKNFPSRQHISISCCDRSADVTWEIEDFSFKESSKKYDLIWHRRPSEPVISEAINPADHVMAFHEARSQLLGIDYIIGDSTKWINDPHFGKKAANKIFQLQTAIKCGLTFPPTIFSNSPKKIREFAKKYAPIIYKPFYQASWTSGENVKSLYTAKISLADLQNDASLTACPGIFQKLIEKNHEIRLTIMGDVCVAVKIDSYANELAATDWRSGARNGGVKYQLTKLPKWLIERSKKLMRELGISFGCLDFIVDVTGEYQFLEVNPAGQFLWIEYALPEVPVLEYFCNFVISHASASTSKFRSVTLKEFDESLLHLDTSSTQHILSSNPFHYADA